MTGRFKRYDKLLIVLVLAIACLTPAVALATNIDATRMVPCHVEPSTISVNITSDGDVAYGMLAPGETQDTITLGDTQTVKNTGDVTVNFQIKSSNAIKTVAEGTDWTLVTTTPLGLNEFNHEFCKAGAAWSHMSTDYVPLKNKVKPEGFYEFDLRITMPSSTDDYQEHTITVTILAV